MTASSGAPTAELARVVDAQRRFELLLDGASDAVVTRPTRLPGWTVGHLLSHVARNAESHRRRADAAARGEIVDQYPGGLEGRAREIDAGASRPAAVIVADVTASAAALHRTWDLLPTTAWDNPTRDVLGRGWPLRALVDRRWQELEVHAVDLDLGRTQRDWSATFVSFWLPRLRAGVEGRLPAGASVPTAPVLDERDELAWLYGRLRPDSPPALAPWA